MAASSRRAVAVALATGVGIWLAGRLDRNVGAVWGRERASRLAVQFAELAARGDTAEAYAMLCAQQRAQTSYERFSQQWQTARVAGCNALRTHYDPHHGEWGNPVTRTLLLSNRDEPLREEVGCVEVQVMPTLWPVWISDYRITGVPGAPLMRGAPMPWDQPAHTLVWEFAAAGLSGDEVSLRRLMAEDLDAVPNSTFVRSMVGSHPSIAVTAPHRDGWRLDPDVGDPDWTPREGSLIYRLDFLGQHHIEAWYLCVNPRRRPLRVADYYEAGSVPAPASEGAPKP